MWDRKVYAQHVATGDTQLILAQILRCKDAEYVQEVTRLRITRVAFQDVTKVEVNRASTRQRNV